MQKLASGHPAESERRRGIIWLNHPDCSSDAILSLWTMASPSRNNSSNSFGGSAKPTATAGAKHATNLGEIPHRITCAEHSEESRATPWPRASPQAREH